MIIDKDAIWYCLCRPDAINFPISKNGGQCGFCLSSNTPLESKITKEEWKRYMRGKLTCIKGGKQ